jgi:hypothetical protein
MTPLPKIIQSKQVLITSAFDQVNALGDEKAKNEMDIFFAKGLKLNKTTYWSTVTIFFAGSHKKKEFAQKKAWMDTLCFPA